MSAKHEHGCTPGPMPCERAQHLLNPLRALFLSPKGLAKRLDLKKDSEVLELGPGPGYFSPEIARTIPEGKIVLVDIQQEMLEMARRRLEKRRIANAEYIRGDAASLLLPSESFDVAFLVTVLGEIPDRGKCLHELHRVLRPHGLLSITEQSLDPHFIPIPEVQTLVEKEGFRWEKTYGRRKNYTINFRSCD